MANYENISELQKPQVIFDLTERVVLIIGGGGKMGQQFAHTLAYAGAKVIIADIDDNRTKETAKKISKKIKSKIIGIGCNVSNQEEVEELFNKIEKSFKKIDVLIYNVMAKPIGYYKSTEEYSMETWKSVLDGNLTGAFLCVRRAAENMKKNKKGSIILTSSTYGISAPDQRVYKDCSNVKNIYNSGDKLNCPASYSASKAGLIGIGKYFASLYGQYNIRVNMLTPGGVYDGQEKSFHQEYINRTILGRMAVWSDYNGAILFLASDASRYMTGANLIIDGGWTAW